MSSTSSIKRVALVGNYLPRRCGIATFTYDLCQSIRQEFPGSEVLVLAVSDRAEAYSYPPEVRFEIEEQNTESYERAADFINYHNAEVVCVQHEYGIYGGPAGSYLLSLLRRLRAPIVTTLHTVLKEPNPDQYRVMREVIQLSDRLVVMTQKGFELMTTVYNAPTEKLDLIPHGIPDMPFVDPNFYKDQFGVEGKKVLLTFGLLSPNKGIEYVIQALPEIVRHEPNLVYIVLGATHPNILKEHGESYRLSLERLAAQLHVKKHVIFYNRFVDIEELKEFLGAADIYITPYLNKEQITSGTLSYAFGCGKAVISTPYWHAEELLADGRGILVPFRDSKAIAEAVISLLKDEVRLHSIRKQAYLLGREMVWNHVARLYMASFAKAREPRPREITRRYALKTLEEERPTLPELRLNHLLTLTDSVGLMQHALWSFPRYAEGYCTDDNTRALLLGVLLEETGDLTPEVARAISRYAAFVQYAFIPEKRWFRNFMSFSRQWLDEGGSEDCYGRAIWALGTCVSRSKSRDLSEWAVQLLNAALPSAQRLHFPRGIAYTLLGVNEYLRRFRGDRVATQIAEDLIRRLIELYERNATEQWLWFEEILTYANARLPQALIQSARILGEEEAGRIGLRTLEWLMQVQSAEGGHFRPIGNKGWYKKDGTRAQFDQQPIEAGCSVSACLEAFLYTQEERWLEQARRAFEWFLGRNDLGLSLYNPRNGGCADGLRVDHVNPNQGAESTVIFLIALEEMKLIRQTMTAFERPVEHGRPQPSQVGA